MKKVLYFFLKLPFHCLNIIFKFIFLILKCIFGYIFGWIPDLDERMSGIEFEEYVKEILIRNGYKNVQLTKKSGDYGIDILATYRDAAYAIQCKMYSKPVGVGAIQQAYSGCEYYECDYPVVVTNHRFTAQAQKLAEANGVELWDGEYLKHLKNRANSRSLLKKRRDMDVDKTHELKYQDVIEILLEAGYASCQLLMEKLYYSEEMSVYILEDLEFYELISCPDDYGICDLYFMSMDEAINLLEDKHKKR